MLLVINGSKLNFRVDSAIEQRINGINKWKGIEVELNRALEQGHWKIPFSFNIRQRLLSSFLRYSIDNTSVIFNRNAIYDSFKLFGEVCLVRNRIHDF